MATSSKVQVNFDDHGCGIRSDGRGGFTTLDGDGNSVSISLRLVLRLPSIAESEKQVGPLPADFWKSVEHVG
jgi:hypothetical protein